MSAVRRVVKKANDCRRFKAKISYSGEQFSGWQKQGAQNGRSFRTVEETLETCIGRALAQVFSAFSFERRLLFCL
jgi:tRNA U38,U39,U40 pseudouridine synthase TruA